MSSIKTRSFQGPTQHLTLRHPFSTRSTIFSEGIPIGIDAYSRELICLDPAWLKSEGIIDSMMFAFFGVKGYGKSGTLKIFVKRLAMMTAGFEELRVSINDHKVLKHDRDDGSKEHGMEYDSIARLMGCEPFVMSRMRVNPFDHRLCKTYSQLLAMTTLIASFSADGDVHVRTKRALRVATLRMHSLSPELWSPLMLLDVVRTLCEDDVSKYNHHSRELLKKEHEERVERLVRRGMVNSSELREINAEFRSQLARETTLSPDVVLDAKEDLFDLLDDIFSGPDADIFGDSHSMFDMYAQRACVKQWVGFASGGNGETIMRTLDAQLTTFIIENGMMELMPHLDLNDELHKGLENPISAQSMAWLSKISRSLGRISLGATQRQTDLLKGSVDSQHYRWGESIIDDLGGVFLARQRGSKEYLDSIQDRYYLTNTQRDMLPRLPKYTMFIKGSEEYPASLMHVFATPLELPYLKTDQSNEQLLLRPGVGSLEAIEAYAEVNGVKLISNTVETIRGRL